MIVLDFLFYCVYFIVPRKSVAGKRYGTNFIFTFSLSFLILGISFLVSEYWFDIFDFIDIRLFMIGLWVLVSLFTCFYYFRCKKLRYLIRRFEPVPRWVLKTGGILCPIVCFCLFMGMTIYTRIHPNT